jgi:peptide/nickel transport system permease protein
MGVYIAKRLAWSCVSIIALTLATYVIFFQIPAEPARFLVRNQFPTTEQLEEANRKLGTDRPLYEQYGRFVWRLAHLDLGVSYAGFDTRNERKVSEEIRSAAPITVSVLVGGALMVLLVAIPLGTLSALRPGSLFDRGVLAFVLVGVSLHPVVIGGFLREFFGYQWQLAPPSGYCTLLANPDGCAGPQAWAGHLILPWITFSALFIALYTRMMRVTVLETLHERWVQVARAKGASESRVLRSHVVRNSMMPIVTMLGMDLGLMFGSVVFVESVFFLPGLGTLAVDAASGEVGFDLPILTGVVLIVSTTIILLNLAVDLLYAWLDPRIRVT